MFRIGNKFFVSAEDYQDRHAEVNPKDLAPPWIRQFLFEVANEGNPAYEAMRAYDQGDYALAIEHLSKASELSEHQRFAHFYRGVCYMTTGQISEAIDDFTRLAELDPTSPVAYIYRGKARIIRGHYRDFSYSVDDFAEAIRLKPDYADAFFLRGFALAVLRRSTEAYEDWKTAKRYGFTSTPDDRWKADYFEDNC